MEICWDSLEDLYLSREGNLKYKKVVYIVSEINCKICGNIFLYPKNKHTLTEFCSKRCSMINRHILENGKPLSILHKAALSAGQLKRFSNKENHPRWKGGVSFSQLPLYDTFNKHLIDLEKTSYIIEDGLKILQIKCIYCGVWFIPKQSQVVNRIKAIVCDPNGRTFGEARFYCSDNCKKACPTFGRHKFPKEFKLSTSREVQSELRKIVLERDRWTCQRCEEINIELHCHHITGISQNPIESADIDNCVTLCKECHRDVHKQVGCKYNELRCN